MVLGFLAITTLLCLTTLRNPLIHPKEVENSTTEVLNETATELLNETVDEILEEAVRNTTERNFSVVVSHFNELYNFYEDDILEEGVRKDIFGEDFVEGESTSQVNARHCIMHDNTKVWCTSIKTLYNFAGKTEPARCRCREAGTSFATSGAAHQRDPPCRSEVGRAVRGQQQLDRDGEDAGSRMIQLATSVQLQFTLLEKKRL